MEKVFLHYSSLSVIETKNFIQKRYSAEVILWQLLVERKMISQTNLAGVLLGNEQAMCGIADGKTEGCR